MLKGRTFECKRHLNQLSPTYVKDVKQKDREELPMEIIYDSLEIAVPIPSPEPKEKSSTPPVTEVTAPRKELIPQIPPAQKVVRRERKSLFGSRWALSEDSGFKSYPSRPEVYLVTKKRGAIDNSYGRQ